VSTTPSPSSPAAPSAPVAPSELGPAAVISDTSDPGTFSIGADVPGADVLGVTTEVNPGTRPVDALNSLPAANADNPQGLPPEPIAENRPQKEPGEPDGFILTPGSYAKRIPVRRVEGSSDFVQAREDVWVKRPAINAPNESVFTLLIARDSVFPIQQLNTVVI
jgi:hypothetical protein